MTIDDVLQMIDALIVQNQKRIDEINADYTSFSFGRSTEYQEGAIAFLEILRDAIKQKAIKNDK